MNKLLTTIALTSIVVLTAGCSSTPETKREPAFFAGPDEKERIVTMLKDKIQTLDLLCPHLKTRAAMLRCEGRKHGFLAIIKRLDGTGAGNGKGDQ